MPTTLLRAPSPGDFYTFRHPPSPSIAGRPANGKESAVNELNLSN